MSDESNQTWQQWFEALWADREERIYREFFGDTGPGIYPIPQATFAAIGIPDPDPRYLFHGVFECPPNEHRGHWLYVSSGMSNPWGDSPDSIQPGAYSGLGCEFTVHVRERALWPVELLHWFMAVQLGIASGRLEGELVMPNDRIHMGNPLPLAKADAAGAESGEEKGGEGVERKGEITHLLVILPNAASFTSESPDEPTYPAEFSLASGRVELLLLVGITRREADFAGA